MAGTFVKRKKTVSLAVLWWTPVFAALIVAAVAANLLIEDHYTLARARIALLDGGPEEASLLYKKSAGSAVVGADARAGLAVCAAATGEPPGARLTFPSQEALILRILMRRDVEQRSWDHCLALARLAEASGLGFGRLFGTAALLEKGLAREAAAQWQGVAPGLKRSALGISIRTALELLAAGARTIVRDRQGALCGAVYEGLGFKAREEIDADLIPKALLKELIKFGEKRCLRLSIDLELSATARDSLGDYRGSIVLLDPRSGEVLAAVSDERSKREWETPAFQEMLEPASIAKIVTTVAGLRAGLDVDAEINGMECAFAARFAGKLLYCPSHRGYSDYEPYDLQGLSDAMASSCNIAFARLGVLVGRDALVGEFRRFGFDGKIGNPFSLGRIVEPWGDERQLADMAIGLEATEITPLHAALLPSPLANDGLMPVPTLFSAGDGVLGLSPRPFAREPGSEVLAPEWQPLLLRALVAVTSRRGTATYIDPPGFQVAMKTGTGGGGYYGYHVNYVGIGPLPRPRLAFAVRVTREQTSPRARRAAYEVTRRLLLGLREIARRRQWADTR